MSALTLREASLGDLDAVDELTVGAYIAAGQVDPDSAYLSQLSDAASRARQAQLLVAVDEQTGRVVGSVTFCLAGTPYAEIAGGSEAEFRMLAVHPRAQGRGVGEALVRQVLWQATEHGCDAVVLCTRGDEYAAPAQRLYTRLGFVRAPERDWAPAAGIELYAWRLGLPAAV